MFRERCMVEGINALSLSLACRSGVCNLALWTTGALQMSCCRPTCPSTGSEVGDLEMGQPMLACISKQPMVAGSSSAW